MTAGGEGDGGNAASLERLNRFKDKWDRAIERWNAHHSNSSREGAAIGRLALQTAYLLNGAGLGVLPAFISSQGVPAQAVFTSALIFTFGIIFAVAATLVGYYNFLLLQQASLDLQMQELANIAAAQNFEHPFPNSPKKRIDVAVDVWSRKVNCSLILGVIAFSMSMICFVTSVFVLLIFLSA